MSIIRINDLVKHRIKGLRFHVGDKVRLKGAEKIGGTGVVTKLLGTQSVTVKWASGLQAPEFVYNLVKTEVK